MRDFEKEELRITAISLLIEKKTIREVANQLNISKTTVQKWKKEHEKAYPPQEVDLTRAITKKIKEPEANFKIQKSKNYTGYIEQLGKMKERQAKFASAITETGIRSLKLANRILQEAEAKKTLTKYDMSQIRLVPGLLLSSSTAVKSAVEAEDRAYSLEMLIGTIDEISQTLQREN